MHIIDITEENVQSQVIEASFQRLVVVDFWADWCEPCKTLLPVLEKLAAEYSGQFLLAKINADSQQMLAGQFGVRSLPTVMFVKEGKPIDGFTGAQSESQVRELLEKHLPKTFDLQLLEAKELIAEKNFSAALPLLKTAYVDSMQRADIALAYADTLIQLKRLDEAQKVLAAVKLADQDAHFHQLQAQLELAQKAGKSPELETLEKQLAQKPEDLDTTLQLAVQYAQNDYKREALVLLYGVLKGDLSALDGELRKVFTDILSSLDKGDALAVEFQRKLYTLLY